MFVQRGHHGIIVLLVFFEFSIQDPIGWAADHRCVRRMEPDHGEERPTRRGGSFDERKGTVHDQLGIAPGQRALDILAIGPVQGATSYRPLPRCELAGSYGSQVAMANSVLNHSSKPFMPGVE